MDQLQQNLVAEKQFLQNRNDFMMKSSKLLKEDHETLQISSNNLPDSKPTKLFRNGLGMLGGLIASVDKVSKFSNLSKDAPVINLQEYITTNLKPELRKLAEEKKVKLDYDLPERLDTKIQPEEAYQLLSSVITNAIMFSQPGSSVSIVGKQTMKHVSLTIKDRGEGMTTETVNHLFEPFSRGTATEQLNHEGLGLNLHTDKVILDKLNGKIDVQSSASGIGKGTTVTMQLKRANKAKEIAPVLITPQ